MKLTDTQLVLLSAAAQREDGTFEIGPKLKGSAAQKVLGKLLSEHLVEEIPAQGTLPVWRRDDSEGALALRTTEHGLAAIGPSEGVSVAASDRGGRSGRIP
jgi:hypothetical protein